MLNNYNERLKNETYGDHTKKKFHHCNVSERNGHSGCHTETTSKENK